MKIFCAIALILGLKNIANPEKPFSSLLRRELRMPVKKSARSRKIQIHLSSSQDEKLSRAAKRFGVTKSAFVRVALEREFALDKRLDLECYRKEIKPEGLELENDLQPRLFEV
jgi:hypothetical protein